METLLDRFRETNALLNGHFILSSGRHSGSYLQCALALQHPDDAAMFGRQIAEHFADTEIDTLASPAIGGLIIGFAVAQAMGKRFIWTERENGVMTVRRGFAVSPGERILVVEDVITTGGSTRECIAALTAIGGNVMAAASIVDRSNGVADVGVPRISLIEMEVESFAPDACPMCAQGIEAVKPGSRTVPK